MGWKGVLRSMAAAQRAAERDAIRQQRHLQRLTKEQAKLNALQQALQEVDLYDNWISRISSIHQTCGSTWDWKALAFAPPPPAPPATNARQMAARHSLETFTPGILDKILRQTDKKLAALRLSIDTAMRADAEANASMRKEFESRYNDWEEMRILAQRVLAGEPDAYREAIDEIQPFEELIEFGSHIELHFPSSTRVEVVIRVNGETVVPSEMKTLLQSGKLSVKKMPQGQFYELYQDYVVGAIFRVARELLAVLPAESAVVTAESTMLDGSTGYLADQPIVSVMIPRATLGRLNFNAIDPSEALKHFTHRMDFKKLKGFSRIEPIGGEMVQI